MWRTFTTSNLNGTAGNINPFAGGAGNPSGWANLQFAFSEAPLPASELTVYNLDRQQRRPTAPAP